MLCFLIFLDTLGVFLLGLAISAFAEHRNASAWKAIHSAQVSHASPRMGDGGR